MDVNVEQNYCSPSLEGKYSTFYHYVGTHMVHPEDQETYLDMMNPETILSLLQNANGIIDFEFRTKNTNGSWRWCDQYVPGGAQYSLPDGIVYCYDELASPEGDPVTGTLLTEERTIL